MERFGVQEVYGMHNMPGLPIGQFAIRPGSIMAAADRFSITIEGKGAHAARPHDGIDTILVASHVITAMQSIASRNVDPLELAVVSVCMIKAGETFNVSRRRRKSSARCEPCRLPCRTSRRAASARSSITSARPSAPLPPSNIGAAIR